MVYSSMASAQLAVGLLLTVATTVLVLIFSCIHKRRKATPNTRTVNTRPGLGVDQDQVALVGVRFEAQPSPSRNPLYYQESEASSSYSAASGHEYEVFLSFMGKDTRRGFTDHLYHRMTDAGISVFKDNVNLPGGDEIALSLYEAIKKSKIAIPILSTNYASSRWCLDELVCILESRNMRKQRILPIFYDVTPSQVRHQTGSYAKAFKEHVKKYGIEVAEKWKAPLVDVSQLKGLELEKETAGLEGELTKLIVAKVLSELKKAHLVVANSLVGIDCHANAVRELLQLSRKEVKIVGIWGMGGIGKTTLAKFIYNQILDEFECCSFLKDVRETSQQKGLEVLQTQLVFDLSKEARRCFTSTDEGINELKRRFHDKKVLVLLDDVDQIHQLNGLAPETGCFGPGSRIIITTRTRDVLDLHQVREVYEVKEMGQEDALRLFCWHAFRNDGPKAEFKALSDDVVKTTGGLPLALKVIGSLLSQKRKPVWEETLHKLKCAPKEEVQERLKISYDRLDDDQKHMFLDVACLFIGEDIDVVMHVWKGRNFSAEMGIYVLLVMSLIQIGEENRIWMHDQLRDLGREIVRKENCKEPGKRSRLWRSEEARDALKKQVIKSDVEALHLRFDSRRDNCINDEQLRNSENIWYLHLYYGDLIGDFQHLLPELRWLTWRCSSSKCTATNLNLEKLLVLDLSSSWSIRDDWELWNSFQVRHNSCHFPSCYIFEIGFPNSYSVSYLLYRAKKLTFLNLTSCMKLSTLDVSMFIKLKRLILDNCVRLKAISMGKHDDLLLLSMENCQSLEELSLCSVANLERLSLANCRSIKTLPDSTGKLRSLIELDLSGTHFPCLPSSICDLENLQVLKVFDSRICSLPITFLESEKLHLIDNFSCESWKGNNEKWTISIRLYPKVVKSLSGSEGLSMLKFSGGEYYHQHCKADRVLERLNEVEALQVLHVIGCGSTESLAIPSNLNLLVQLDLVKCQKLQRIEGLDELQALRKLNITECGGMINLPRLSKLKCLRIFNCYGCEKLQEIQGLEQLEALEELNLGLCREIKKLPVLSELKSLRILNCNGCDKFQEIEGLYGLEALEVFNLKGCIAIEKLPGLSNLRYLRIMNYCGCVKLQELNLEGCRAIETLPSLSTLGSLRILNCYGCEELKVIEELDGLDVLQEFNLEGCRAIEKLPSLSSLNSLRILNCYGCEKLQEIEGLDDLNALEEFNLTGCSAIENLPRLCNKQSLRILNYYGCEKLQNFSLIRCKAIEKLPSFSSLRSLRELFCDDCDKLQEIEGLDGLEALKVLSLEGCRAIKNLPRLSNLSSLRILNCCGCEELQEIEGLDSLKGLVECNLEGCRAIEKLPRLSDSPYLRLLKCRGCDKLKNVEGLDGLKALEEFNLEGCRSIEKLPSLSDLLSLRFLNCRGCEKLQEIKGLDRLEELKSVDISKCRTIRHIPVLPQRMTLKYQWLDLSGCENYKEIHRNPKLRVSCSICQLSAKDLVRIKKYGGPDYNEFHVSEQFLETAELRPRNSVRDALRRYWGCIGIRKIL